MFEHMAFKGTPNLGTKDYQAEQKAIDAMEAAYQAYERARSATTPDAAEVARLHAAFKTRQAEAQAFVVPNAFDEAVSREGGVGLNASTSAEATTYYYSLPTNKFELFAYLESERFLHPVFREFYKERDVVMEERRQRTESQPIGRLIERLLGAAFFAHPYKQPTVGYMSDLERFTITDAREFYDTWYAPANMVTAIVGGVKASEIIPVIERYFGRLPAKPKPAPLRTIEPPHIAETVITLKDQAQPFYIEAYHKPAAMHPDEPVYDAIAEILGRGRTSRLYRSLVEEQKLAVQAQVGGGLPGVKYPHLFLALAVPARGVTNDQVRDALRVELQKMVDEDVTDAELERFKTRAKADLIRSLTGDSGLA
jgi:predicted Zn-dependent peptidase